MLTRRQFIRVGSAGALLVTAGATAPLFIAKAFSSGQPGATVAGGKRALVVVELAGGNDGLNTVIPFGDPAYYSLRPTLGIPADQVLKLKDGLGLHPSMTALHRFFQEGKVAVVQGVGYPNPNYSHFEAHDIWASAQMRKSANRSGWLGRYLDGQTNGNRQAASLAGETPMTLYSQTTLVPAINGLENFVFRSDDYLANGDGTTRLKIARQVYQRVTQTSLSEYIRSGALDALTTADVLQKRLKELEPGKGYPADSELAGQLAAVVQLLLAGLDFRVFYVRLNGFDTHTNQLYRQGLLLKDLSDSLVAFYKDLSQHGMSEDVLTMTFSEFGRRPQENGGGTDHGSAEPMFVIGGKVKGGIYGTTPSLSDLDDDNLKHTLDFRQIYATVLKDWLAVTPAPILGSKWDGVPLLGAATPMVPPPAVSGNFNDPGFARTWSRVDKPVQEMSGVGRGYTWGPPVKEAVKITSEPYNGTRRTVQYFDKARMEVNNPSMNPNDLFYVTTGLLVKELVTGKRQDGDNAFTQLPPSTVQIAGDPNEGGVNLIAPTYASFASLATFFDKQNWQTKATGSPIKGWLDKSGKLTEIEPVETRLWADYDEVSHHNIADVFVSFVQLTGPIWNAGVITSGAIFFNNPLYVLGRPVTEAYWVRTVVAGVERDVLVQLFERRVLTYTPTNPVAFRVEMGNVGQHYYRWRYVLNSEV